MASVVPERNPKKQEEEKPRGVPRPRHPAPKVPARPAATTIKSFTKMPSPPPPAVQQPPIDISEVDIDVSEIDSTAAPSHIRDVPGTVAYEAAQRLAARGITPNPVSGSYDPVVPPPRNIKHEQLDPSTAFSPKHIASRFGSMVGGVADLVKGTLVDYPRDLATRSGLRDGPGFADVNLSRLPAAVKTMGADIVGGVKAEANVIADSKSSIPRRASAALNTIASIPTIGATSMVAQQADTIDNSDDPLRTFTSAGAGGALLTAGGRQVAGEAIRGAAGAVGSGMNSVLTSRPLQTFGRRSVNRHLGPESVGDFGQNAGRGVGRAGLVAASDQALYDKVVGEIDNVRATKNMLLESPGANTLEVDMRGPVMEVLGEKPLAITEAGINAWDQFAQRVVAELAEETGGTYRMTPAQADAFKYRIGADFERTFTDADFTVKKKGQQLYSAVDRAITDRLPGYGEMDAHLADLHQAQRALEIGINENEFRRGPLEQPMEHLPMVGRSLTFQRNIGTRSGVLPLLARTGIAKLTHNPVPSLDWPIASFQRGQIGAGEGGWNMDVTTGKPQGMLPGLQSDVITDATGNVIYQWDPPVPEPNVPVGQWVNPQLNRPALPPAANPGEFFAPIQGGTPEFVNPALRRPALPPATGATVLPSSGATYLADTPNNPAFFRGREGTRPATTEPSFANNAVAEAQRQQPQSVVPQRASTPEVISKWAEQELDAKQNAGQMSLAEETKLINDNKRKKSAGGASAGKSAVPTRSPVGQALADHTKLTPEQIAKAEQTAAVPATAPAPKKSSVVPERKTATANKQPGGNTTSAIPVRPVPATAPESPKREPQVRTTPSASQTPTRRSSGSGNEITEGSPVFDPQTGTRGNVERIVEFGVGPDARKFVKIKGGKNLIPLDRVQRGNINGVE